MKKYYISVALYGYLTGTVLLKYLSGIDITISCPIRYATGHKCLGCGLTTATLHLLRLDFRAAFESNPLIYIVLPLMLFLGVKHWIDFIKRQPLRQE